MTMSCEVG